MRRIYFLAVIMLVNCVACRDKFEADVQSMEQSFLVVEGNLNAAAGTTILRLTRTFQLDIRARLTTENNATVLVEGKDNTTRPLINRGNGYYVSPNLNLIIGTEYRLRIRVGGGNEYLSDYVKARATPPIDSLNWEQIGSDVTIYVNTHDPANSTRYYRWDFDETWHIRSSFFSYYVYENGHVRPRVIPGEEVQDCWKYDSSKTILLANSTRLQNDVIFRAPLTKISDASEKLGIRYSMQARQYALDKEAYDFFEEMKRNTEEIGNIFTPQPSQLRSNIHCISDPSEYVLGYVTASTEERKRFFVSIPRPLFRLQCGAKMVTTMPDSTHFYFAGGNLIPYDYDMAFMAYWASTGECVDCRTRGGSLRRPSYW